MTKKTVRSILSLMIALMMVMGLTVTAVAAESTVTYKGSKDGFEFKPGSEYTATDLFDNFKNVMPGDVLQEEITFTNSAKDCDYVKLYVRAEAHDENNNPLSPKVLEAGETVATMEKFLSQLSMKVWNGDNLIYEASPNELKGLKENTYLGQYRSDHTATLTVELDVPMELGNEFANRVGEVDWIFVAEAFNDGGGGGGSSGGGGGSPGGGGRPSAGPGDGLTIIEPLNPPLAEFIPVSALPKTGDTTNLALWMVLMAISGCAMVILLVVKRRMTSEES